LGQLDFDPCCCDLEFRGQGPVPPTTVSIHNGGSLIGPQDLLPSLFDSLEATGGRMLSADEAQVTLTDANGSRSAQITVQAPGYLAYREGQTRAIVFDGTAFQTLSGQLRAASKITTHN
jgi:hypothetical protein